MKAFPTTISCIVFLFVILLQTACRKEDYPHGALQCRVHQLIGIFGHEQDTITIKYNSKGNPVEMNRAFVSTGSPRYVFKYDKHDRLTDLIGLYNHPTNYEIMFRFAYDHKNRIKSDTQYTLGFTDIPNIPEHINEYEYDSKDRMIRFRHRSLFYPDSRWTYYYHYDQKGNLTKVVNENGSEIPLFPFEYDDKVNVNSLHPIWQFLSHDYSRNNHIAALGYNDKRLPTLFDQEWKLPGQFANLSYRYVQISYQCR